MIKSIGFEVKQTYVWILSLQKTLIKSGTFLSALNLSILFQKMPQLFICKQHNKSKTVASAWPYWIQFVLLEHFLNFVNYLIRGWQMGKDVENKYCFIHNFCGNRIWIGQNGTLTFSRKWKSPQFGYRQQEPFSFILRKFKTSAPLTPLPEMGHSSLVELWFVASCLPSCICFSGPTVTEFHFHLHFLSTPPALCCSECHQHFHSIVFAHFQDSGSQPLAMFFFFKLKYSSFIMFCLFLLYSKVTQLHTCIHSFKKYSFLLWFIPGDQIWFPVLYSRTSLSVHSKCNGLHLLTPNSQSIPPLVILICMSQ